eukprot:scaffold142908_cov28-Tisochrysis_lutea.AAC.1
MSLRSLRDGALRHFVAAPKANWPRSVAKRKRGEEGGRRSPSMARSAAASITRAFSPTLRHDPRHVRVSSL